MDLSSGDGRNHLMTVNEVSRYLRISRASVYRLAKMKNIPVSKVGRQLRFRQSAIDKWLSGKEEGNHKS